MLQITNQAPVPGLFGNQMHNSNLVHAPDKKVCLNIYRIYIDSYGQKSGQVLICLAYSLVTLTPFGAIILIWLLLKFILALIEVL